MLSNKKALILIFNKPVNLSEQEDYSVQERFSFH